MLHLGGMPYIEHNQLKSFLEYSLCCQFLNDLINCILNGFLAFFIVFYFGFDSTFNIPSCRIVHPRFIEGVKSARGSVGYSTTFKVHLQTTTEN